MELPLRIAIDDRERGASAAQALMGLPEALVAFRRLRTGDYLEEERLLVERKSMLDFAVSMVDGRLFRQAERLACGKLPPLLILEGSPRVLAKSRFRREALRGALITVTLSYGIPVLRSRDGEDTARLILQIARQIRHTAEGGLHRAGRRPKGKRAAQIHLLQGLPRVGPAIAANLLTRFGSVEAAFSAGVAGLLEVEGIGQRRAQAIRWVLEESGVPYQADGGMSGESLDRGRHSPSADLRCKQPSQTAQEKAGHPATAARPRGRHKQP